VDYYVERGIAQTEFLGGEFTSAANRLKWLLNESSHRIDDDERVFLERLALACAIQSRDWHSAREIVTSWSATDRADWAALGRVAIGLGESAVDDGDRTIEPARSADLAGFADTLGRLGASPAAEASPSAEPGDRRCSPATHLTRLFPGRRRSGCRQP
jgi:hypothetical protein